MNVLLAIVLFGVYLVNNNYTSEIIKVTNFNFVGVEQVQEFYPIIVREVNQAGPANGKIKQGDAIVAISETRFKNVDEFRSLLASNKGKETQVSLLDLNDNSIKNVTIDLSKSQDGAIGISISLPQFGYYIVSYPKNILSAFAHTYNIGIYQFPAIAELINKSIRESDPSYAAQSVSGVVGVTAVVNQLVVSRAVLQLINLTALVSISLAIVNVLPLPVLDGGQLLIAAVESTRRRKLSDTVLNRLNFASLVFVLGLTILITFKDIWQFNVAGEIVNFVKKILSI